MMKFERNILGSVTAPTTATALPVSVRSAGPATAESGNCKVGLKFYQEMRVGLPELQSLHITGLELELLTPHNIIIIKDKKVALLSRGEANQVSALRGFTG